MKNSMFSNQFKENLDIISFFDDIKNRTEKKENNSNSENKQGQTRTA